VLEIVKREAIGTSVFERLTQVWLMLFLMSVRAVFWQSSDVNDDLIMLHFSLSLVNIHERMWQKDQSEVIGIITRWLFQ
jgi:hypothetical protein